MARTGDTMTRNLLLYCMGCHPSSICLLYMYYVYLSISKTKSPECLQNIDECMYMHRG